jgi:hypothetical protein
MAAVKTVLALLLLAGSVLLTNDGAAAKGGGPDKGQGKPQRAHITWSTPRIEQNITPGQTVTVTVNLTSTADLTNVALRVPGGLRHVVAVEPAAIASLKAGVAIPVKLTMTMPTSGAHNQGGIVQVRVEQRNVPSALHIKLTLPGTANDPDDADDGDS